MRRGRRSAAAFAGAVLLSVAVAGCTGSSGGGNILGLPGATTTGVTTGGTGGGQGAPDPATSEQHATYGYGAVASGVDYQPDVVVVGGGASSIESASADGLTWYLKRSAPGADRLQVGKVLLLTSQAAGRIVAMHDDGDARVVTLAPVELTDILRNGKINVDQAIGDLNYQNVPGLAPGVTTPTSSDLPGTKFYQGPPTGGSGAKLPPAGSSSVEIPVGAWKIKPYANTGKLGLNVSRAVGGLKLSGDIAFTTSDLHFHAGLAVANGKSTGPAFRIDGINGLVISLAAGVAGGGVDNGKATINLPGQFTFQLPPTPYTAELPLTVAVKYKVSVSTALTGKNATLLASGKYKLSGPIGFEAQKPLVPTFAVDQSIIDSITGISLGPSGVVVALNFSASVGIGPPVLNAGPMAGLTVAIGVTNGSSLGAPLARCKGATLDLDLTYGAGINFDTGLPLLKALLPKGTKLNLGFEFKKNLLHRSQVVPDVPLCTG